MAVIGVDAGEDLTGKENFFVKLGLDNKAYLCGDGEQVFGVVKTGNVADQNVDVWIGGLVEVFAGHDINNLVYVSSDANGKARVTAANDGSFAAGQATSTGAKDAKIWINLSKIGILDRSQAVDADGKILVSSTTTAIDIHKMIFSGDLTNNGSEEIKVDGSVTPVDYKYSAHATDDIELIKLRINFVAGEWQMQPTKFGSGSSLANGISVLYSHNGTHEHEIINITNSIHLLSKSDSFETELSGQKDVIRLSMKLRRISLSGGSQDAIVVRVRDDLTSQQRGIESINATIAGYKK